MKNLFPYVLRENQREAIEFLEKDKEKNICIGASTGFGKTPIILSALLPHIENGDKIIWLSRTGNETDRPIEELKKINEKFGKTFFGISFRGKKDMCLLVKDRKLNKGSSEDVNYFCKINKEFCNYYSNLKLDGDGRSFNITDSPKLFSELLDVAKANKMCPYYLQYQSLHAADVLSINYNQVLNKDLSHMFKYKIPFENTFLVVDEAHNLQSFAGTMNSRKFAVSSIENSIHENRKLNENGMENVENFLLEFKSVIMEECTKYGKDDEFDIKKLFSKVNLQDIVDKLTIIKKFANKIRKQQLSQGKLPHSSLNHFASFWGFALENFNVDGIAFIITKSNNNHLLEIWDMRSKELLQDRWIEFKSNIFSSGTLKPVDAFADVIGLKNYSSNEFTMLYNSGIKTMITKGLSTKGANLGNEMIENYLQSIKKFVKIDSNLAIYFASYRIQDCLINGIEKIAEANKKKLFVERQGMEGSNAYKILKQFKECAKDGNGLLCASMQGRFSEGIDLPGRELEGIFVVGIPFDSLSVKTKLYLQYYEKIYGKDKGRYYAYVIPALRRVSQTLGRALRSKEDKAVFVLGDERFLYRKYFDLLPNFVKETFEVVQFDELNTHF